MHELAVLRCKRTIGRRGCRTIHGLALALAGRMTLGRSVVPVLGLLALATSALAQQSAALQCVREQRLTRKTCTTTGKTACDTAFNEGVPPCFGDAAPCAQACLDTQTACQTPLRDTLTSCQAACTTRENAARQVCEARKEGSDCTHRVRIRGLKCRSRCVLKTDPQLQDCGTQFNQCLKQCAGGK